jgi:mRNA-degrading endonuclease RelE of RelBE toxin-antitoxin system
MYNFEISENLQDVMRKLSKKDKSLYEQLIKKIQEIVNSSVRNP